MTTKNEEWGGVDITAASCWVETTLSSVSVWSSWQETLQQTMKISSSFSWTAYIHEIKKDEERFELSLLLPTCLKWPCMTQINEGPPVRTIAPVITSVVIGNQVVSWQICLCRYSWYDQKPESHWCSEKGPGIGLKWFADSESLFRTEYLKTLSWLPIWTNWKIACCGFDR